MTVYQYNSYESHEQPPEETPQDASRISPGVGTTTSVTIRDGVAVTDTSSKGQRVLSSEINPHHGDGSVFATARDPRGLAVRAITPETLITVGGVQAPVSFFEAQGIVHRGADGRYNEGSGEPQESPEETLQSPEASPDFMTMTTETARSVDDALEGVADHHIDPLAGVGIGVATGDLDVSVLEGHFSKYSGLTPEESASRVAVMQSAYQQQADSAITSRCGIDASLLPEFYSWCKGTTQKGALRDAVQKQVHSHDLSGYRMLASKFLAENAPSVAAVKAGGYETRQHGDKAEMFIDGRWLTIATAARLGYV